MTSAESSHPPVAWLGVVSADHVRDGAELGIVQIGHGTHAGLARMKRGDTFVYYSPVEHLGDRAPLRQFTAYGTITDDEIWQATDSDFRPFRRRLTYADTTPVPLDDVRATLHLTASPSWGYQLRRGLVPLHADDAAVLCAALDRRQGS